MIRLFVIEDHSLIVDGLRNRFRLSRDGIEISGSASSVAETIKLAAQIEFDIIFLDLWLPGSEPLDNVRTLRKTFPDKPIIVLTNEASPFWKMQMMREGVRAYLVKNVDKTTIKSTIETVSAGGTVLPETYQPDQDSADKADYSLSTYHLKPSEKEIISMLSKGMFQKEVAEKKGTTVWAIEKTLRKLRR
ncbi:MAG: response regulator transcription factor [Bacteroidota bacterium]